jgi:hypothetical protein
MGASVSEEEPELKGLDPELPFLITSCFSAVRIL